MREKLFAQDHGIDYARERQNGFSELISPKNGRQIKIRAVSDRKHWVTSNQRSLSTSFPL